MSQSLFGQHLDGSISLNANALQGGDAQFERRGLRGRQVQRSFDLRQTIQYSVNRPSDDWNRYDRNNVLEYLQNGRIR